MQDTNLYLYTYPPTRVIYLVRAATAQLARDMIARLLGPMFEIRVYPVPWITDNIAEVWG